VNFVVAEMAPAFAKRMVKSTLGSLGFTLLDLSKNNDLRVFLPGHLKSVLEILQVNCVIDVGANIGEYGLMLRRIGYRGRIVSFEPVREVFDKLKETSAGDDSWTLLNFACGSDESEKDINIFGLDVLSSLLPPSPQMSLIDPVGVARTETVRVVRLDSILDELIKGVDNPRVFLKTDAQGYDLEVIKGAGKRLSQVVGLQSEIAVQPLYVGVPDYLDFLAFCRELGFEPTGFFPIFHSPVSKQMIELDAVLTRREAVC
jgi:FkbM family methyltransferase